ncbi:MAG TPA: undecaprenyldiphospho-muramoylpentapeptide beta-N-acetylglucosaminyltransferase [Xanthomonadaceae bacterium]|jgi:UDP-N-acetylglucosamine--N-acetylmuramyl-(pentapeptide) pyrophosphoryl-undecaprenol N-acetylglucosamine transferase
MILAGGTGGHIFPGIAVARALIQRQVPVVWLGSAGGMETRLVPQHGIAIDTLKIGGLRGKGALALLAAPFKLMRALFDALAILRRERPRSVLSMGGFAAGPGGIAAWLLRRPLIVHEGNRAPGFTNRVLAKFARRVLCGFPGSFRSGGAETVGNPVRAEVAALPTPEVRFADRGQTLRVLVLGGSQGARALNTAVPKALAALTGVAVEVRHQCGEAMRAEAIAAYADAGVTASIEPFIQDMAGAYGWADLLVCRAGAMTLAEVCAAGVGALLVPFPAAVDDHQTRNAEYLVERGAARLLPQHDELETRLRESLRELLVPDRKALLVMAHCARAAALPEATAKVVEICIGEARP